MKSLYLGDSYDHVKRTLISCGRGKSWIAAVLLTESVKEFQSRCYEQFLGVKAPPQFLISPKASERKSYFVALRQTVDAEDGNLFLDPCTGVRPDDRFTPTMREHVSVSEIFGLLTGSKRLLLCYDQSLSRGLEDEDRKEKLQLLSQLGLSAFYFRSHASMLCASFDQKRLDEWRMAIADCGIPCKRIQLVRNADSYVRRRASRGSAQQMSKILQSAPDVEPDENDWLPEKG